MGRLNRVMGVECDDDGWRGRAARGLPFRELEAEAEEEVLEPISAKILQTYRALSYSPLSPVCVVCN